jgi:glycosyltransferase involved in cell wall biosynthesis
LKIAFVSDHILFPTGYGIYTHNLMTRLRDRGHECMEFALQWGGAPTEAEGFKVYPGGNQQLVERGLDIAKPQVLIHVRDNWVFIPRFFSPAYHFWPMCKARNIAFVAATPIQSFPVPVELAQTVSTEADLTLVQAECEKKALVDMGAPPDRIATLYHGVDPKVFHPGVGSRTPLSLPNEGPMLLTVGTNTERKNLPGTILVLSKLLARHPNAFLYIHTAPMGFYALDCHTRILGLTGKGKVWLPPDRGNPQVAIWAEDSEVLANAYRAANVYLSTTFAEGFGAPTLEAIASGLPVVITDTPIHRELFSEFSHVSFIPSRKELPTPWGYDWIPDPEAAATLVDRALSKGKPSQVTIPRKYLWPDMAAQLERLLEPLVKR